MAATHLLDTTVLSQPIKNSPSAAVMDRWSDLGDSAVCTSAICVAELLQGLEIRQSKKYWRRYRELLENRFVALPFDQSVALVFGKVSAVLRSRGEPGPVVDLLIASTAIRHKLIIATLNTNHFDGIPGLHIEDWSID